MTQKKQRKIEKEAMKLSEKTWNVFAKLPDVKPGGTGDRSDVAFHIRAIQNIIYTRRPYKKALKKTK